MGISASAPWLNFYGNMPKTLNYPEKTIYQIVHSTALQYPDNIAYDIVG